MQCIEAFQKCLPEQAPLDRSGYLKGVYQKIDTDKSGALDVRLPLDVACCWDACPAVLSPLHFAPSLAISSPSLLAQSLTL